MNNKTKLVDIILPNYNGAKTLRETMNSIINQSFQDFNLYIIDDFSNDKSISIIEDYSDPRVNLIKLKKNKGVYFCRNLGMRKSNSKYLAFIDSDDYYKAAILDILAFAFDPKYFQRFENRPRKAACSKKDNTKSVKNPNPGPEKSKIHSNSSGT